MLLALPVEPLFILHTLYQAGYEGYIVGGSVRDLLSGQFNDLSDFDFTTNATPEQLLATFPESFYENQFGTVSITKNDLRVLMGFPEEVAETPTEDKSNSTGPIDVNSATKIHVSLQSKNVKAGQLPGHEQIKAVKNYEITTYRSEGKYTDHRRPDEVTWGKTLQDDLSRRDFTFNAMAIEVKKAFLQALFEKFSTDTLEQEVSLTPEDYSVIDPFSGQQDLEIHVLRPVGEPVTRFEEDALRMLRAVRFSVQLNVQMTDETFAAISGLADHIQHVSWERIRDEFLKMLASDYPAEAVELLDETGLLHFLLPELREGKGIEQGGHHTTDVWTHSLDALATCPSKDPIVRFATLLHDIAKPRTLRYSENGGKPTFYNHEIVGARIAKQIAERFKLSRRDVQRIFVLVRQHMFYYQPYHTDAAIRRFMRNVGLDNVNDILDLREGDRLGSGARKTSWRLEEMKQRMIEQLHQPFDVTDLAINGNDLMTELNIKPGPMIGKILNQLFEEVMENPEKNTREYLLERAKDLLTADA